MGRREVFDRDAAMLRLVERAYSESWDPFRDLSWDQKVDWHALDMPDPTCLVTSAPHFRKLSRSQRRRLKRHEMASHLSGLAFGELKATTLAGETAELSPDQRPHELWFLASLMTDEGKHFAALTRYLDEKLKASYPPHPALKQIFDALTRERDYELNLYVGQVLLEGAAASLLAALLLSVQEPLLRELLRRVTLDEARHMKFADIVMRHGLGKPAPARRRRMEEILFEGAAAGASSLLATRAWHACGLSDKESRPTAVEALKQRGVLQFYTRVVGQQLERHGFPSDTLKRTLETRLEDRLRHGP